MTSLKGIGVMPLATMIQPPHSSKRVWKFRNAFFEMVEGDDGLADRLIETGADGIAGETADHRAIRN